ncbi:hypothetical protein [Ornithinimicrobium kibberense]|uniref:hypothetical protein n=1 Tax=Ornithinimicrobium kibberense TaxID=282060 RepID=UPI0036211B6C
MSTGPGRQTGDRSIPRRRSSRDSVPARNSSSHRSPSRRGRRSTRVGYAVRSSPRSRPRWSSGPPSSRGTSGGAVPTPSRAVSISRKPSRNPANAW